MSKNVRLFVQTERLGNGCVRESDSRANHRCYLFQARSERSYGKIPVVDGGDCLLGIIAQADVATRLGSPEATGKVVEEISH